MKRATLILTAALLLGGVGQAKADTINFADYYGSSLSSAGGVSFSLSGGPGPGGTPKVDSFGQPAIGNSPTGNYPTSEILQFSFSSPANNVSFFYSNYGFNGSFYDAYSGVTLVSSGVLGSINGGLVTVPGSGITSLQINNNTGGSYSWEFGVYSLTFTPAAVPEPTSLALFGLSTLAGAVYCGWRRRKQPAQA